MQITLTNTGKRYNRDWVFRHLNYTFTPGKSYAITGPNGSGKSTLLQVIAGAVMHSEGDVDYRYPTSGIQHQVSVISNPGSGIQNHPFNIHHHLSFCAPYLELVEEMTSTEFLYFHSTFKKLTKSISEILEQVGLQKSAHKQIRYYSSGMKQRLKLAQAFFSDTLILLLDEPTTNLDEDGIHLYLQLIELYTKEKLVIISSNDKVEYKFCEEEISIMEYKK